MNEKERQVLFEELIVGVGFLNGFMASEGISPKVTILKELGMGEFGIYVSLITVLVFLWAINKSHKIVQYIGPITVLTGFAAGWWFLDYTRFSILLLLFTFGTGMVSSVIAKVPSRRF